MSVSSVLLSPLRFFERTEVQLAQSLSQDTTYPVGTRFERSLGTDRPHSEVISIFNLIESLNTEPLFAGNGIFLLNRPGVISDIGAALSAKDALVLLESKKPIVIRLARARPAPDSHIKLVPMKDFGFRIESPDQLKGWWQKIGRMFLDCVF